MTNNNTGRTFDEARRAQGFTSQAHLDAFFAHYDHNTTCPDCAALDGWCELSDGYQPTKGSCPVDKALYRAYLDIAYAVAVTELQKGGR